MADKQSTDAGLRELALFAGAGGGILGGKLLGWRTVCAVEWEPYAAGVLCARQNDGVLPPFPIWDDMLKSHIITSRENGKWTRNINTELSATASFAGRCLRHGTKSRRSNAAPTLVVDYCKHARQKKHAQCAGLSFCHQGRGMKRVRGNAGQRCGCLGGRLTPWLKSGGSLLCSVAGLSLGASETKPTGRLRFLAIPSKTFGRISSPISSQECHGKTTEKGLTHGA